MVLASSKAVYILVPLPLERQIQDLLASHRVEEALTLTEAAQRNIPKEKYQVHQTGEETRVFLSIGERILIDYFLFLCCRYCTKNSPTSRIHPIWPASVFRSKEHFRWSVSFCHVINTVNCRSDPDVSEDDWMELINFFANCFLSLCAPDPNRCMLMDGEQ